MRGGEGGTRAGRPAKDVGQWPSPRTRDAARPEDGSSGDEEGCALERCAAALKYRTTKTPRWGKRAWLTRVGTTWGGGLRRVGAKEPTVAHGSPHLSPPPHLPTGLLRQTNNKKASHSPWSWPARRALAWRRRRPRGPRPAGPAGNPSIWPRI